MKNEQFEFHDMRYEMQSAMTKNDEKD